MADDEEFDFEGDSSMKDLIAKMGDIDKAIEDIHELDKAGKNGETSSGERTQAKGSNFYETPGEAGTDVIDIVVSGDDDFDEDGDVDGVAGLADLQKEMQQLDKSFEEKIVKVSCVKPVLDAALGISMKTSKGITRIVGINSSGLLANSELKPAMQLLSVNGASIKNAKHAKFLIDSHPRDILLEAKTLPPTSLA